MNSITPFTLDAVRAKDEHDRALAQGKKQDTAALSDLERDLANTKPCAECQEKAKPKTKTQLKGIG